MLSKRYGRFIARKAKMEPPPDEFTNGCMNSNVCVAAFAGSG